MRLHIFFPPFMLLYLMACLPCMSTEPCHYNTTTCVNNTASFCLGSKISFLRTSVIFANDSATIDEAISNLAQWELLRGVPDCWAVIQPFLCSVYLPKCDNSLNQVELPNKELCERTREPCKVVPEYNNGQWPEFLRCDQGFYGESCESNYYGQRISEFNITGICNAPLILTTDSSSWYEEIRGCGIQCQNPLFTEAEHNTVHIFIAVFGSLCIACTLFTLLTFVIDWKTARRYPAVILFFINGCFFMGSIGWMAQFAGNARNDIVCRADGTIRKGEPQVGSGESASCTIVFVLVYYFMMAGVVWFVMLAFSWDITFKALGTVRDDLSKKTAYFHIISWCLPLVLTIVCIAISQIDGDSVSGICFVGYQEKGIRGGFVLAPVGLVLVVGMIFIIRGLHTLIKVRKDSPQFISDKATAKIRGTILRLGIFAGLAFAFVLTTFSVHLYTFTNEDKWAESFKEYIYCEANVSVTLAANRSTTTSCQIENRPSLAAVVIHVLGFFGAGIAMSSWSWTKASLEAWERFFRRVTNKPTNKPTKLKKHRMIAKAFERKKQKNNGRLSISFGSSHDDPLGMKFDLNSVSSRSMSSSLAAGMPKLMRRRGGMMHPVAGTLRRYSDSDIASMVSHMTQSDSRHMSYESSMSQKLSDLERDLQEVRKKKRKKKRRKKRNTIQPILEPISSQMAALHGRKRRMRGHRRNSDTSSISKASAHSIRLAMEKLSMENFSMSSNILSDSTITDVSEIFLPQPKPTDFSVFTANSMLPKLEGNTDSPKGDNPTTLKGATPSPSGSFRRGRRREVKLEVTETSFYQEDSDAGDLAGGQGGPVQDQGTTAGDMALVALPNTDKLGTSSLRVGSAPCRGSANVVQGNRRFGSASNIRSTSKDKGTDSVNVVPQLGKKTWTENYVISSGKNGSKLGSAANSRAGSASSYASRHSGRVGLGTSHGGRHGGRIGSGTSAASWSRYAQAVGMGNVQPSDLRQPLTKHQRVLGSAGSRGSNRSQNYNGDQNPGSASSKGSRSLRYDGIKVGSASSTSSRFSQMLQESSLLPGVEGDATILNLVDYEVDDDDDEDDYDSYYDDDDTLTEVSSLR